ncbi:serpin-Z1-like [Phragmites australis]|uniref:serpin-Z1-like n=1 Tax=Phragmites australis TaxID=29695 RepID=UPI002D765D09|nr:serpin-Z1-like [Phragmites australis]
MLCWYDTFLISIVPTIPAEKRVPTDRDRSKKRARNQQSRSRYRASAIPMEDDQVAAAARDLAALSMLLLRHLGCHHQQEELQINMAFSPMSFHAILSLLAVGATDTVRDQINLFLGPAGDDAHAALASKVASYVLATHDVNEDEDDDAPPPEVRCATGIWVDSSLVLKPAFAAMAASRYKAEARAISFRGMLAQARAEINEWIEGKTGGHLKGHLPESSIGASTLVVLANALYFRGYWYDHFLPDMTRDGTFYVSPGHEVTVPFMEGCYLHDRMHIGCHPGFKVLRMAYASSTCEQRFSMYIYLPDDRDGLPGLVHELSSNPAAFLHMPDQRVPVGEFKIPKFDVSLKVEASRLLGELGLDLTFFRPAGDSFSEMVALVKEDDNEDMLPSMAVPSIVHQCSVHVNEKGTVAAAAIALEILGFGIDTPDEPVADFVADHPFLFFIKEDHHHGGVVVFAGQVVDPSPH